MIIALIFGHWEHFLQELLLNILYLLNKNLFIQIKKKF
jgi:hypothetical protein